MSRGGWRYGAGTLGPYAKAYQLLLLPIQQINTPLTSVAIPALSRLQDQPERYRKFYKHAMLPVVAAGMLIIVFIFVAADDAVLLILGSQWTDVAPLFRALAPAAMIGTFNVATGWVYISLGQAGRQTRWEL